MIKQLNHLNIVFTTYVYIYTLYTQVTRLDTYRNVWMFILYISNVFNSAFVF